MIIAERERTYTVSLVDFWKRRARRLLPALGVLLVLVTVYTVIFEPSAVGQLRGDVVAGFFYGSNWYQLFVGLGYTAAFDFAPLRHLWSLAVEEQFYVVWPLVMVVLLGRKGTRRVADVSRWLFMAAVAIAIITALLYHPGVIGEPNQTPEAYWFIGDRAISKLDFLYIGTFSRSSGILLGAAFAMLWRPFAVMRGPLRDKGWAFDVIALMAFASVQPDVLEDLPRHAERRRRRSPLPRWAVLRLVPHHRDDRRDQPSGCPLEQGASATSCWCGSVCGRTGCTSTTGRSIRRSASSPATS